MARKIVQIAVRQESESMLPAVYALASDGTVWGIASMGNDAVRWFCLPALPQEDKP